MSEHEPTPQFTTAEFQELPPEHHGYFARGLLFGLGGALVGLAIYAGVVIFTGYEIGLVSLAVGFIVGRSVVLGSRGRTGTRYQVAAAVLTYFAVSMATIPVALTYLAQEEKDRAAITTDAAITASTTGSVEVKGDEPAEPFSLSRALFTLLLLGLASPFLQLQDMPGGLISIAILAFGIQIAWKTAATPPQSAGEVLAQASGPSSSDEPPTSLNLSR